MNKRQIKKTKSKTVFPYFDEFRLIGMTPEEREAERALYKKFLDSHCRFFHYRDKKKIVRRCYVPIKTTVPKLAGVDRDHASFVVVQKVDPETISALFPKGDNVRLLIPESGMKVSLFDPFENVSMRDMAEIIAESVSDASMGGE